MDFGKSLLGRRIVGFLQTRKYMEVAYAKVSDLLDFGTRKFEGIAPFSVATGYHLYVEVRLDQSITAPETKEVATKYLRFLQRFTWLCSNAFEIVGGTMLEAQGARVHLLVPSPSHSSQRLQEIVEVCAFLSTSLKAELGKRFEDKFSNVAFALDFGEATLLRSRVSDSDSVVSLGNCANQPAKRLGYYEGGASADTVHDQELSFPKRLDISRELIPYLKSDDRSGWLEVFLWKVVVSKVDKAILQRAVDESLRPDRLSSGLFDVRDFSQTDVLARASQQRGEAVALFGWMLRADLEGFSAKVASARSEEEKAELASCFYNLMGEYNDYVSQLGVNASIPMPWAGDCANLLLLPRGLNAGGNTSQQYADSRTFLPVVETSRWFDRMGPAASGLGVSWAIGFAGGNHGRSSFNMLRATLSNGQRQFPIVVGKCVKMSSDAENSEWLDGDELALFREDHDWLRVSYRAAFEKADSKFYSSSRKELKAVIDGVQLPKAEPEVFCPRNSPAVVIPSQRPYLSNGG